METLLHSGNKFSISMLPEGADKKILKVNRRDLVAAAAATAIAAAFCTLECFSHRQSRQCPHCSSCAAMY